MKRLVEHRFEAGQRWRNAKFTLYIVAVNDDYYDENEVLQPGRIAVTEQKPIPGRKFQATDLSPDAMENVIAVGEYRLDEESWHVEFHQTKAAMDEAAAKDPARASAKPAEAVKLSGLGAMMS